MSAPVEALPVQTRVARVPGTFATLYGGAQADLKRSLPSPPNSTLTSEPSNQRLQKLPSSISAASNSALSEPGAPPTSLDGDSLPVYSKGILGSDKVNYPHTLKKQCYEWVAAIASDPHRTQQRSDIAANFLLQLAGETTNNDLRETDAPTTSHIGQSLFSGYATNKGAELALAPIGRNLGSLITAISSTASKVQENVPEAINQTMSAAGLDPEALASEVYSIIKRRLLLEKERVSALIL